MSEHLFRSWARSFKVRLKLEKRDAWIGVYWNRGPLFTFEDKTPDVKIPAMLIDGDLWEIYICVLPFVPLKLSWIKDRKVPVIARPATLATDVKGNQ